MIPLNEGTILDNGSKLGVGENCKIGVDGGGVLGRGEMFARALNCWTILDTEMEFDAEGTSVGGGRGEMFARALNCWTILDTEMEFDPEVTSVAGVLEFVHKCGLLGVKSEVRFS